MFRLILQVLFGLIFKVFIPKNSATFFCWLCTNSSLDCNEAAQLAGGMATPEQLQRVEQIHTQLVQLEGKRWLQRQRSELEQELTNLRLSPQVTVTTGPAAQPPKSSGGDARMICIVKPRYIQSRPPVVETKTPNSVKQISHYGTLESTFLPLPDPKPKRKVGRPRKVNERPKRKRCDDSSDEDEASIGEGSLGEATTFSPVLDLDSEDYCSQCNIAMKLLPHKALMVCTVCGCVSSYIDSTTNSMAYGEEIDFSQQYSYRRANHWRLAIAQLQAIENTEVKQEIIDQVLQELYNVGITRNEDVTPKALREVLKKLKLRKCYDHIPQIYSRITGIPPIRFTPEIEERFRLMFIAIQEPFAKVAPPGRRNFLSYKYLLNKIAQLCGMDELMPFLPLLKGKDKLMRQDAIYKGICTELGWQYIPSA